MRTLNGNSFHVSALTFDRVELIQCYSMVSRRAMRLVQPVAFLICMLVVGCSHPSATPHRESGVLLLDNRGGFSHDGRRIALRADGSYTDTNYTDVIGTEHTKKGRYTFRAKTMLLLPKTRLSAPVP